MKLKQGYVFLDAGRIGPPEPTDTSGISLSILSMGLRYVMSDIRKRYLDIGSENPDLGKPVSWHR